jgi:hypothetical protein
MDTLRRAVATLQLRFNPLPKDASRAVESSVQAALKLAAAAEPAAEEVDEDEDTNGNDDISTLSTAMAQFRSGTLQDEGEGGGSTEDTSDGKGNLGWDLASWLGSITLEQAIAEPLVRMLRHKHKRTSAAQERAFFARLGKDGSVETFVALLRQSTVVEELAHVLYGASKVLGEAIDHHDEDLGSVGAAMNSKFVHGGAFTLSFGRLTSWFGGLDALVGPAEADMMEGMKQEHTAKPDSKVEFTARNYGTTTT